MAKLLSIVFEKLSTRTVDVTMKFTLSALWNLTGNNNLKIKHDVFTEYIKCMYACYESCVNIIYIDNRSKKVKKSLYVLHNNLISIKNKNKSKLFLKCALHNVYLSNWFKCLFS